MSENQLADFDQFVDLPGKLNFCFRSKEVSKIQYLNFKSEKTQMRSVISESKLNESSVAFDSIGCPGRLGEVEISL